MAEVEVPLEAVQELGRESGAGGVKAAAYFMTTAMALLTALAGMLAGARNNEATLKLVLMSQRIGSLERSEIRSELRTDMRALLGSRAEPAGLSLLGESSTKQAADRQVARTLEIESKRALGQHEDYARSMMLFQMGILLASAAAVARRRFIIMLWLGGAFGMAGLAFFAQACFL